jgi:hypothetical protein
MARLGFPRLEKLISLLVARRAKASVVSTAIENLKIPAIQCSTCFWALLGI